MRNMKDMKQSLRNVTFFGLLATIIASCGSAESESQSNIPITEKISFPTVEFTIAASSDTTIFGQQGTRLFIEKETFQFADGTPVKDSIKIELNEFYKKSDITLANLSTESDGKLLETGGMLNISATCKGQEIEIKADKRIVVHFPKAENNYKQMNLFYSGENSTDTSVTNWNVDTVNLVKRTLKLGSYGWQWPEMDDSTGYDFEPKNYVDTGYYWNPIDFYVSAFNFSEQTKKEIETNLNQTNSSGLGSFNGYGIECEMTISVDGKIKNPSVNSKVSKATKDEILSFLKNIPTLEPGKNKFGKVIERKGFLFITGGNIIPLYKTEEEYIKSFSNKYSKYEKTPIKNIDDAELEYYIFSVAKLGWINCDRFLESEKTVDYYVQTPIDKDTKIKMVFKDIDGVLMARPAEGKFIFSKVPIGRQVTIVAIKNANGQFQTAFQDVTISDKPLEILTFKEMTLNELKQQLEKLN